MKRYVLGIYEKALPDFPEWEQKLLHARQAGYDFLEMSLDETDKKIARLQMPAKERLALLEAMARTGVPVRSMCLSAHRKYPIGSHDPAVAQRGMQIMEKAIDLADDLGIRMIMLAGYDVYYEDSDAETRARFAANLQSCVELAARKGVTLAFETMETPFMNTVGKAMRFVRQVGSPYLQVYPDIGNITNAAKADGADVTEDMQTGAGHLVGLHLKETSPGVFRDMMYGDGHVDFPQAIHTAWQMGVRRYVTEFWYHGEENWFDRVCFAARFARELLDKENDAGC